MKFLCQSERNENNDDDDDKEDRNNNWNEKLYYKVEIKDIFLMVLDTIVSGYLGDRYNGVVVPWF